MGDEGIYPVQLRLSNRRILVVGGGPIASRKISALAPTGARITVVAPSAVTSISDNANVTWHQRPYERGEVASYRLAITCTGDPAVDRQVFQDGEAAGVWVNSADDLNNSTCLLPAVVRLGPVSVAVGTEGTSPALASFLRRRIEADLDGAVVELADLVGQVRAELKEFAGTSEHPAWGPTLDAGGPGGQSLLDLIKEGGYASASRILRSALGLPELATPGRNGKDRH